MHLLPEEIQQSLRINGIEQLNEMQLASMAAHRKADNIILYSATGTGKTFAFLLPLIERLQSDSDSVQALILVPARELAIQIETVFKSLRSGFKISCCYGGHSMQVERNNLQEHPAVLVGTPGRLAYHMRKGNVDTFRIPHVIIDEFDKSLEFGFLADIEDIFRHMPKVRKRTFTSATQLDDFPAVCKFTDPVVLDYTTGGKVVNLEIFTVRATGNDKLDSLRRLLSACSGERTIVFCNHREAVDRVSELLGELRIHPARYHGGMEQHDREISLVKFRNGSCNILVTTDLASRGIDIPEIMNIVHYQLPATADVHTHRNGRTARMHASGKAYYMLGEQGYLPDFIPGSFPEAKFPQTLPPPARPEWESLHIGLGKKDKVNKVDIVGFLYKQGALAKDELGQIDMFDFSAIAAVKATRIDQLIRDLKEERLKKKKVKLGIVR